MTRFTQAAGGGARAAQRFLGQIWVGLAMTHKLVPSRVPTLKPGSSSGGGLRAARPSHTHTHIYIYICLHSADRLGRCSLADAQVDQPDQL